MVLRCGRTWAAGWLLVCMIAASRDGAQAAIAALRPQPIVPAAPTGFLDADLQQAADLDRHNRPRDAEGLLRAALERGRSGFGARNPQLVAVYADLATNLDRQGRNPEAEPLHRIARTMTRKLLGDFDPETQARTIGLALCLSSQNRPDEAQALLRPVQSAAEAIGPSSLSAARLGGALGSVLLAQDHGAEAEPLLRRALEAEIAASAGSAAVARTSAELAADLLVLGRYAEAEPFYRAALAADQEMFGDTHYDVATDADGLGLALDLQGRHLEAEPLFRRALEIRRLAFGDAGRNTAAAYNHAAGNLNAQGRFAQAEPLYRKALDLDREASGERHPDVASDEQNLALNLGAQQRLGEAEPLLRKALAARRTARGGRDGATGAAYGSLASNLLAQGKAREAERLDRKALAIVSMALGDQHPLTGAAYLRLAADLDAQGQHPEAQRLLAQALDIRQTSLGESHRETAAVYDAMAQNLALQDAPGEAEALSARAVTIIRDRRAADLQAPGEGPDAAVRRARASDGAPAVDEAIYSRRLKIAWTAAVAAPADLPRLRDDAFQAAQELEAPPAARAMAQTAARDALRTGANDARRQQDLSLKVRTLESQLVDALSNPDATRPTELGSALDAVGRDLAAVDSKLSRENPGYDGLSAAEPLTIAEAQRRLRPGEGLLFVAAAGEDLHVFALTTTTAEWKRLPGGRARVVEAIHILRCQVDDRICNGVASSGPQDARAFDTGAAFELYRQLLAPVEPSLRGADRLFVVASGALARLPLSLLVTRPSVDGGLQGVEWLTDRYALTTLPSVFNLRSSASPRPVRGRRWAFMGYGDPVVAGTQPIIARRGGLLGDSAQPLADTAALRAGFPSLPGAGLELRAMARVLGAPRESLRLGARATEGAVKNSQELSGARVIDFATHGLLSNEVKGIDEPGLLFTPPSHATPQDDGILTASEAARLRLTADWVILSACNTAASEDDSDPDGASGLARAFLYAGAKALLVSHWRVYDAATAALTVETLAVHRAHPALSKAQDLQRAIRAVRTGQRADGSRLAGWSPEWAHPAYWAPFVLISSGD